MVMYFTSFYKIIINSFYYINTLNNVSLDAINHYEGGHTRILMMINDPICNILMLLLI